MKIVFIERIWPFYAMFDWDALHFSAWCCLTIFSTNRCVIFFAKFTMFFALSLAETLHCQTHKPTIKSFLQKLALIFKPANESLSKMITFQDDLTENKVKYERSHFHSWCQKKVRGAELPSQTLYFPYATSPYGK